MARMYARLHYSRRNEVHGNVIDDEAGRALHEYSSPGYAVLWGTRSDPSRVYIQHVFHNFIITMQYWNTAKYS